MGALSASEKWFLNSGSYSKVMDIQKMKFGRQNLSKPKSATEPRGRIHLLIIKIIIFSSGTAKRTRSSLRGQIIYFHTWQITFCVLQSYGKTKGTPPNNQETIDIYNFTIKPIFFCKKKHKIRLFCAHQQAKHKNHVFRKNKKTFSW